MRDEPGAGEERDQRHRPDGDAREPCQQRRHQQQHPEVREHDHDLRLCPGEGEPEDDQREGADEDRDPVPGSASPHPELGADADQEREERHREVLAQLEHVRRPLHGGHVGDVHRHEREEADDVDVGPAVGHGAMLPDPRAIRRQANSARPTCSPGRIPGGTAKSADPVTVRYSIRASDDDIASCTGTKWVSGSRT